MIHTAIAVELGFVPDQPIDATQVMPAVRPAAERAGGAYPDPGPDLNAIKHTRWPDDPAPEQVPAASVYEQGGAILRRLAVIDSKLDELLAAVRQNGGAQ